MKLEEIRELDSKYGSKVYSRFNVAFTGGKNATLRDETGREYIDFGTGIGVNIFGVNDEEWKSAVVSQLNRIQHTSNLYYAEPQAKLAKLLCEKSGAKRVFFGNSGAEVNECAFKAARKYSFAKYGKGRARIISLNGSFHGRTLFALSATGQDRYHKYFDPFVPETANAEANIKAIERTGENKACAVVIECVQGESGVNALDKAFVKELAEYCRKNDVLLICDEVQCGNGRTGKFFAYEHYGIVPDLVTTAKGIGGGLPLGACLFFDKTENVLGAGDHGSTFGGNPVACAGACNVVERLTGEFLLEVTGKAEYLRAKLAKIDGVKNVAGIGLMIGFEADKPVKEVAAECLNRGLLLLTANTRLRLLPPLTVTKTEMDEGLAILRGVLAK
ncbi:MAG: acetylornithine/succinylornithine family transaminase [Clostridia bacterium]|nr:acetylornithine/succinylornithine family transaminase [Clostridia bacterium]